LETQELLGLLSAIRCQLEAGEIPMGKNPRAFIDCLAALGKAKDVHPRISSSLEDKNPGEPPEVTPEDDRALILDPGSRPGMTPTISSYPL